MIYRVAFMEDYLSGGGLKEITTLNPYTRTTIGIAGRCAAVS